MAADGEADQKERVLGRSYKMSRGRYYTEDENNRLKELANDMREINPNVKWTEIAEKAMAYGICTSRPRDGIAEHISKIMSEPKDTTEDEDVALIQEDIDDILTQRDAGLYRSIRALTFNTMTLWEDSGLPRFNFPEVIRWWKEHEPDMLSDRIERLEGQR